jgi:hypothetical protein
VSRSHLERNHHRLRYDAIAATASLEMQSSLSFLFPSLLIPLIELQILYNEDTLSVCRLAAGTVMSGLKLQIMTENNTLWEPSGTTSLVVKADWNKAPTQNRKKVKGKKGMSRALLNSENPESALNLPDIKVNR